MLAPILLDDTESSDLPDAVSLTTIERIAAEQAAALLHATATGGDDDQAAIETAGQAVTK